MYFFVIHFDLKFILNLKFLTKVLGTCISKNLVKRCVLQYWGSNTIYCDRMSKYIYIYCEFFLSEFNC